MLISQTKLDFWIKESLNVLFTGEYGVGKSSIIIEAWKRHNLNFKYFSGATMDPWIDFVGVPEKREDKDGVPYIAYILPDYMNDDLEAIFIDEFNRSSKKVRSAVMELIQFKSINGKKFKNLRIVWAAINPEDSEFDFDYDVEKLDPAIKDRFQVHYTIPFDVDKEYFSKKYGNENAVVAEQWWSQLPINIRKFVPPRRLDFALDMFMKNGDINDVLPLESNPNILKNSLMIEPISVILEKYYLSKNKKDAKKFLNGINNWNKSESIIAGNKDYIDFFLPLASKEMISSFISSSKTQVKEHLKKRLKQNKLSKTIQAIFNDIESASLNRYEFASRTINYAYKLRNKQWIKENNITDCLSLNNVFITDVTKYVSSTKQKLEYILSTELNTDVAQNIDFIKKSTNLIKETVNFHVIALYRQYFALIEKVINCLEKYSSHMSVKSIVEQQTILLNTTNYLMLEIIDKLYISEEELTSKFSEIISFFADNSEAFIYERVTDI
jgi:hypothetical protein